MPRAERLKLQRDRAPDEISHGVIGRLVQVQLLNQGAHEKREPTVKLRKKDLLTKHRAQAKKKRRTEDRNFHQRSKP